MDPDRSDAPNVIVNPSQPCVVSAAAKCPANARYAAALGWKPSSANITGQDAGGMATCITPNLRLACWHAMSVAVSSSKRR